MSCGSQDSVPLPVTTEEKRDVGKEGKSRRCSGPDKAQTWKSILGKAQNQRGDGRLGEGSTEPKPPPGCPVYLPHLRCVNGQQPEVVGVGIHTTCEGEQAKALHT